MKGCWWVGRFIFYACRSMLTEVEPQWPVSRSQTSLAAAVTGSVTHAAASSLPEILAGPFSFGTVAVHVLPLRACCSSARLLLSTGAAARRCVWAPPCRLQHRAARTATRTHLSATQNTAVCSSQQQHVQQTMQHQVCKICPCAHLLKPISPALRQCLQVIIVTGCTGVGKSAVGLLLAKRLGGEIVSADSVQVGLWAAP